MASSKSTLFLNYSGKIGNQFVLKRYGNKSVLCALPNMDNRVLSPRQLENNLLMKKANMWAKGIMNNPVKRDAALLRLNITRNKLYTTLIREFFQQAKAQKTTM